MSQQIFDKHWPLAKNGANELIPGAAILQTRDDKDEPITLAAAVQWDESSGLFLPTHKENPLEVRVRELEAKLDELKQTIESGIQLKGQLEAEVILERAVRTTSSGNIHRTVPDWAKGFVFEATVYGATGTFEANQGLKISAYRVETTGITSLRALGIETGPATSLGTHLQLHWYPGALKPEEAISEGASRVRLIPLRAVGLIRLAVSITGSFESGQGIDCSARLWWVG